MKPKKDAAKEKQGERMQPNKADVNEKQGVKTGISHTRRSTTGNVLLGSSVLLALVRLSGCSVSSLAQAILPWDSIWNVSTA